MAFTYLNLRQMGRQQIWPAGEARSRRPAHDRWFADALIECQRYVACLQQNNTDIVPQCATNFNCGLTSFDFPRAMIKSLSVIDKIDPATGLESASAADDYCSEIPYEQVDPCYMHRYLAQSAKRGCCLNLALYFAIPQACVSGKGAVPVPTDEGLPPGLPVLPLGYKYPQTSTDYQRRATRGVWAIERGRIMVAPWIQSTESILIRWDGVKQTSWDATKLNIIYNDGDLIDPDPELVKAILLYVQSKYELEDNRDVAMADKYEVEFNKALRTIWYACNEETRVRGCEPSQARGASAIITLYYNDARSFTASCPANQDGTSVTVTIPADSVSSTLSKQDANNKAYQQAQTQAQAQLVCTDKPVTYYNVQQVYTASCTQTEGAPTPEGSPKTVTISAGQYSSTVSQAAADALALAAAQDSAESQLACTYWNSEQTFTSDCAGTPTATVAAHTYSSGISQEDANTLALNAAKTEAEAQCLTVYYNSVRVASYSRQCAISLGNICTISYLVSVSANRFTSTVSQADANNQAYNYALSVAQAQANIKCFQHQCGAFEMTI